MTITKEVFDEVKRDRDRWRGAAKRLEGEVQRLEVEIANARRQAGQIARQASQHRQIFGGWE